MSSKQNRAGKGNLEKGGGKGGNSSGRVKTILKNIKKDVEKLDKCMDDFVKNNILFTEFAQRIDNWYSNSYVQQMYKHMFSGLGEAVSYQNFIAGLVDLGAPCNELERHILARLLDPRREGFISFKDLEVLLWSGYATKSVEVVETKVKKSNIKSSILSESAETVEMHARASSKKIIPFTIEISNDRWVHVYAKMIKFDRFPEHPGNLELSFSDDTTFRVVAMQVRRTIQLPTISLTLFMAPNSTDDNRIDLQVTFRELGFMGGPSFAPLELVIYYDYEIGYIDDALIMDSLF